MKIELDVHVKGEFGFVVRNLKTGENREVAGRCGNLLLNRYFEEALKPTASSSSLGGIVLGTGNSTPAESNVLLDNFVYGQRAAAFEVGTPVIETSFPQYVTRVLTWRIQGSNIANINISEVGLALAGVMIPTSTTPLLCRALIVDAQGQPTSVTVLADEVLDITYRHTTYAINASGTMQLDADGVLTDIGWEIKPVSMLSNVAWLTSYALWASSSILYTLGVTFQVLTSASTSTVNSSCVGVNLVGEPGSSSDPISQNPAGRPPNGAQFNGLTNAHYNPATKTGGYTVRLPLINGNVSGSGFNSAILYFKAGSSQGTSNQSSNSALGAHLITFDQFIPKNVENVFELDIVMTLKNGAP